ncbi:alpha/beta hydrolase [bacterium]|nr:alpha/beta hydrolase [bacterium]MBU1991259.1 alpha/beta hydrolase [bacterium]
MKKVLLLHGWGGSDFPHWQSWLACELVKNYRTVSFLKLSNYDFPDLGMWKQELKEHLEDFRPDIVICHSLANILWFHLCLEDAMADVEKLYLVAPPRLDCEIEELKTFFPVSVPKDLHAKEILLITSTNDPYLSAKEANELQTLLNVPMKVILNGGHINTDSGFGEWNWMLESL